jgi:hypothetical protein
MSQTAMSVSSHNDSEADDVLEQMLLEAERLAAKMRASRSTSGSITASSVAAEESVDNSVNVAPSWESITSKDFARDEEHPSADAEQVYVPQYTPSDATLTAGSFNDATLAGGSFDDMTAYNDDGATVATDKTTNTVMKPETTGEERSVYDEDCGTVTTDKTMNTVTRPVSTAVETARKMALALEALGATMDVPDSSNDSPTSRNSDSPIPATPDSFATAYESKKTKSQTNVEGEIVAPNTMSTEKKIEAFCEQEILSPSTPLKGVEWQKVDTANKGDDDFVTLVDYSKPSPEQVKAERQANNGVLWEKVNSAHDGDDDYVPLADYSPPASPQRKGRSALTRTKQLRSRKKARRRRAVVVFSLVACAVYWFYFRGSSTNSEPSVTINEYAVVSDAIVSDAIVSDAIVPDTIVPDAVVPDFELQMDCADPSLCTTYREDSESQQSIAFACDTDAVVGDQVESPVEDTSNVSHEVQEHIEATDAATEEVEKTVQDYNDERSEPVKPLVEKRIATTKVDLSPLQWIKAAQNRVASGEGHFVETHHLTDLLQTMLQ